MKARLAAPLRRLAILACAAPLALGAAACGRVNDPTSAENNGVYVEAGNVTYQLQISRQLNQYSSEDSLYVKGVPVADATLAPTQMWYGVFLWAWNQTKHPVTTTGNIDIVDTEGNTFYPIALNTAMNPYAWTPTQLAPNAIVPAPDTAPSFAPTGGELLLFKLPNSVYNNRPLTLQIRAPGEQKPTTIQLDL